MYTESYVEFNRLVQQYISSIEAGKVKGETLNKFFATLSTFGITDKRTNIVIRSVLSSGKRIGYSTLNEVYKYLKSVRKPKNDVLIPLREIFNESNKNSVQQNNIDSSVAKKTRNISEVTYRLRSSRQLPKTPVISSLECIVPELVKVTSPLKNDKNNSVPTPVPTLYLTDISKEQGRSSKSNFLEYFGLGPSNSEYCTETYNVSANFSMSMFNNSTHVPFSSELGRLLAERVNHGVSEDFKLRKIQRLERYINKPYVEKNDIINYPVTYVEKNPTSLSKKGVQKSKSCVCKSFSVVLERVDLLKLQKKLRVRARKRKNNRLYRLKQKCKQLKVVLRPSDKKIIEKELKRKKNSKK